MARPKVTGILMDRRAATGGPDDLTKRPTSAADFDGPALCHLMKGRADPPQSIGDFIAGWRRLSRRVAQIGRRQGA